MVSRIAEFEDISSCSGGKLIGTRYVLLTQKPHCWHHLSFQQGSDQIFKPLKSKKQGIAQSSFSTANLPPPQTKKKSNFIKKNCYLHIYSYFVTFLHLVMKSNWPHLFQLLAFPIKYFMSLSHLYRLYEFELNWIIIFFMHHCNKIVRIERCK